jgi:hypothetical protein
MLVHKHKHLYGTVPLKKARIPQMDNKLVEPRKLFLDARTCMSELLLEEKYKETKSVDQRQHPLREQKAP